MVGEAPWYSGEHGFKSRLHLKSRWKDGSLDGKKVTRNKGNKMGQVTPKKLF
jgi:hypothetical protein